MTTDVSKVGISKIPMGEVCNDRGQVLSCRDEDGYWETFTYDATATPPAIETATAFGRRQPTTRMVEFLPGETARGMKSRAPTVAAGIKRGYPFGISKYRRLTKQRKDQHHECCDQRTRNQTPVQCCRSR